MKTLPKNSTARRAILAASIAGIVAHTAFADLTWNSSGLTNNWSTETGETNWLPGSVVWMQNENAIFNAGTETVTVSTAITFNDITFGVTGFVIADGAAGSLSLANDFASTITVTNSGETATIAETIGNNGSTASALTKAGAGTLVLSGSNTYTGGTSVTGGTLSVGASANLGTGTAVTLNGGGLAITTNALTFAQNFTIGAGGGAITVPSASQTTTLSGVFSGGGQLTLNGTGSTALSGNNSSLSGGVVINAGRIQIATNANALGTGTVTVNGSGGAGGQLFGTAVTLANNFILSGFGGNSVDGVQRGALRLDNGTLNGTVTLAADAGIGANSTNTATINGVINAAGFNFRKSDTGTVNLTAANLNFGDITIGTNGQGAGGTLGITGSGSLNGGIYSGAITSGTGAASATFNYASSTNQTLSGNMTGVVSLTKNGNSTLTLSGTNGRTGATTVNAGTLKLDYGASDTAKLGAIAGALNLGGGIVELSGGAFAGDTVASTSLTAGTSSSIISTNGSAAILNLKAITRNAGATLTFSNAGIATTDTPNTNGILGAWATIGLSDWAMNSTNGAGGLITALNAYADVARLSSGPKVIADDATSNVRIVEGTGTAGDITLAASTTTINTLNHSVQGGGGNATLASGGNTLVVNGVLVGAGAGSLTIGSTANDGVIKSAATEFALINHSANAVIVNSAVNDGAGASSFAKLGTGTVMLNGTNTYTGATTISAGTLVIGGAASLGSGGVYAGAITNAGILQYSSSATQTLSGVISGTGALVKDGTGTLTLSGAANTYSGGTTINGGTLGISNANKLGGATSIAAGATLNWVAAGSQNLTNALSGAGLIQIDLSGAVSNAVLTAGTGFTGTIRISAPGGAQGNKVQITAGNAQNADVIVDPNAQLYAAVGTGGTIKSLSLVGAGNSENRGALRLGSNLTVTNGVTLQGNANIGTESGTLTGSIAGSATTGNTHTLTLGGTTGAGNSTFNGIIGDGTSGGNLALVVASGTQTLSGASAFTGGITIQGNATVAVTAIGIAGSSGNLGNGAVKLGSAATAGTISYSGAGETTDRALSLTGTTGGAGITQSGAGLLKFTSDLAAPGTAAADNRKTLTLSGSTAGTGEFAGKLVDSTLGTAGQLATSVAKSGTGTWTLSGNNTYTGTTTVSGGTLILSGSSTTSSVAINGGTNSTVRITSPTAAGAGDLLASTGATTPVIQLRMDGGGTIAMNNGFGGNSSIATTIDVNNNGSGSNGVIQLNGAGTTGWGGATTLNVTGGNGYSLFIANVRNTGGGAGQSASTSETFNPTTAALSLGNLTSIHTNAAVIDTFVLDGTNANNFVTGVISNGPGAKSAITKSNSSVWTLTGTNTYTGNTAINGGTLVIAGSGSLGTGTYAGIISGAGALTFNTSTIQMLSGANTHTGAMTLNSGKVILSNQGASNSAAYTIASGATLEMNVASGTRTMATGSTLSGGGTFIKSGSGSLLWGAAAGNFAFGSGALIDVQGGQLTGGSNANEVWTNNKADLNVAGGAIFDAVEATSAANGGVFVDALTGDGTIKVGFGTPGQYASKITFGVDHGSGIFNGVLADSSAAGNYIKAGNGTQTFTGTNTYTGTTTVNGGVLRVNGANNGTGAFTVNASGTLGGTGIIVGPVSVSGTLAPGASVESLRTGAASFLGDSTLAVELDSSVPGASGADLLVANGALSLSGTVNLTLTDLAGSPTVFADGTTFTLINYGGSAITGGLSFNNIPLADGDTFTAGLTMWQIDYDAQSEGINFTTDTDQTNFVNLIAVPEPASAASLLGGLGVLLGFQRTRRSRRNEV